MIPDIGLMIGVYIFVRMVSFLTRSGERAENIIVKVLAVFAMLVTAICVLDLLMHGTST